MKPSKNSPQPYLPEEGDPPPKVERRPLVNLAEMQRIHEELMLAGARETSEALLAEAKRNAGFLGRCAKEADAVLGGELHASTRLWLLLREPIEVRRAIPRSILEEIAGESWHGAPRSLDGDALLRLIAGIVRAAHQPSESEEMLEAVSRLLQPFFYLDAAAAGAERSRQGDRQALETFVTAHESPHWREELTQPINPGVMRDPVVTKPTLDRDRIPFDIDSWRDEIVKPGIDRWDSGWPCMGGARKAMSEIDRFGPRYTIDSLVNDQACAGETLTIRGKNFGPNGRVYFESPGIKDPAFHLADGDPGVLVGVKAKTWTDTKIEVVVPVWATAGELHLNAFTHHVDLCTIIDVYRLGNSAFFRGGLASVYEVKVAGVAIDLTDTKPTNLTPGDSVALSWRSSGGPTTRIKIQLIDRGGIVWERTDLPGGFGAVVLTIPDPEPKEPRSASLVFTAVSSCGATAPLNVPVWISVPPKLTIQYVEVTQGVQEDLGAVLAGRGMPTVANKDTAVRVHMNCDRGGWFSNKLDKITGSLLVDGRRLRPTNVRVLIPPDRGFASIRGLSNPSFTNDTLNFTIPAAWLTPGPHTLTVQIVCDDPSGKIALGQSFTWTWVAHAPLRVRAVYMALYGTDEFMLDYLRRALDYLPTPLTDIGIASIRWYSHTYDLSTDEGWNDLADDLEDAWDDADEASGVRWLGIIPQSERFLGKPLAHQGIAGVPSIAALAMGDVPYVGAHELGHTYGLHHIDLPAGAAKGPYDPADNGGVLRRAPFDVRTSTAIPLPAGDLMTYFEPVRPGISTWMRLFLNT
jgi:hypothetical protein